MPSTPPSPEPGDGQPLVLEIRLLDDAALVRALVLRQGAAAGLSRRGASELALAASELATNMVKHANGGELTVTTTADGVEVSARDRGPGISEQDQLFRDGFSRGAQRQPDRPIRAGFGTGGGSLRRLCDEVEVSARPGGGTEIRCFKRKR